MEYKVQRFCWFDTVGKEGSARETIWKYKRAIEGHKLVLDKVIMDLQTIQNNPVHFQIYNGHVYSHWGSFPGIFDQSTLALSSMNLYTTTSVHSLENWECKEVSFSVRNTNSNATYPICMILWFYEVPMTKLETFEYAVKQPRYKIRHGGPRTLDRFED